MQRWTHRLRLPPNEGNKMRELASRGQLRASLLRWSLVTVPLILLLGIASSLIAGAGEANRWYAALLKPAFTPPGWLFPIVWTTLYVVMGIALAMILNARSARGRGLAITLFAVQLLLNLAWSPLFFAAHQVETALWVIALMLVSAATAAWLFHRIRRLAGWLMLPYLLWLCVAGALNYEIDRLNPDAETLVPAARKTQILL